MDLSNIRLLAETVLANVKASVFDKDGCLYPFDSSFGATPGMVKNVDNDCNRAAVYALFLLKDERLPDDLMPWLQAADDAYQEKGSPVYYFAKDYGIDFDLLDEKMHELLSVEKINPEPNFALLMEQAIGLGHRTAMGTHAHPVLLKRSIPKLGLANIFSRESNVQTLSDHGLGHRKHKTSKIFMSAAEMIGVGTVIDPAHVMFGEDTSDNLIPVKDEVPEARTVLVDRYGKYMDKKPSHVDLVVPNSTIVAQALVAVSARIFSGAVANAPANDSQQPTVQRSRALANASKGALHNL